MQDSQDKETSKGEVRTEYKRVQKQIPVGARFSAPVLTGAPSLLYNGYRFSFTGVKLPGRGVNRPLPSSAEVKQRVELYLYSVRAFMACSRVSFTFTFF